MTPVMPVHAKGQVSQHNAQNNREQIVTKCVRMVGIGAAGVIIRGATFALSGLVAATAHQPGKNAGMGFGRGGKAGGKGKGAGKSKGGKGNASWYHEPAGQAGGKGGAAHAVGLERDKPEELEQLDLGSQNLMYSF